ncbi:NAD(+)/NADH kinase [Butyrivibrio sp. INlla16]|uniref:NAD(+)/NADH kinase n=1 Tax=Butyrivibrio sp. INlla16 TaxID=1520807 RepID=UPI0008827904|nr:NAD(+)/NADH kinase [Butyrivibrio sp. INlla16]SDB43672.1 NAD+ kinase [Butyrivibrio sp. INlla16]
MRRFFIITNRGKDPGMKATLRIRDYLEQKGAFCEVAEIESTANKNGKEYFCKVPDCVECCIVLGGDGTMLQAAGNVLGKNIPLIGVNLGTLGYMAEVDLSEVESAMDKLLNDEYEIEDRMMLQGVLCQGEEKGVINYALNDIVIARCSSLRVFNFNVYVNDLPLTTYQSDGIILSSPTGSTAYNMSAGGPIVDPKARILLLTPICPHAANGRTIVLSENDKVTIEIGKGSGDCTLELEASLDGRKRMMMKSGDRIDITAAKQVTKILKLSSESFLNILRKKLV